MLTQDSIYKQENHYVSWQAIEISIFGECLKNFRILIMKKQPKSRFNLINITSYHIRYNNFSDLK